MACNSLSSLTSIAMVALEWQAWGTGERSWGGGMTQEWQKLCAGRTRKAGIVAFIDADVAVELPSMWLAWIYSVVGRQAQSLPYCR